MPETISGLEVWYLLTPTGPQLTRKARAQIAWSLTSDIKVTLIMASGFQSIVVTTISSFVSAREHALNHELQSARSYAPLKNFTTKPQYTSNSIPLTDTKF